jgi:flagellar biosynthetic protein FlhB
MIGLVSTVLIYPYFSGIDHAVDQPIPFLMDDMMALTLRLMTGVLVVFLAVSIADVLYQRWEFNKQMRMTKQEVKDEYKQTEGDPYVKGRLKQLRMEKARQRMMQAVPKADVVITNPTHFAVALKYDPKENEAPVVIAKGVDAIAFRIREVAKEHNVIIYENPPLARSLYDQVEIDEAIPQDLYKAVAEVISFVYQKRGRR